MGGPSLRPAGRDVGTPTSERENNLSEPAASHRSPYLPKSPGCSGRRFTLAALGKGPRDSAMLKSALPALGAPQTGAP